MPDDTVCRAAQPGVDCPMGSVGVSQGAVFSLRHEAIRLAYAEVGVREDAGPNRDHAGRIEVYRAGCVRDGKRLALGPSPWCAALVSWCVWEACLALGAWASLRDQALTWSPHMRLSGEPPIGYRASVAELVADARATRTLHVRYPGMADWPVSFGDPERVPELGDILVFGREVNGHMRNPLIGGEGHCGFYVGTDEASLWGCLGGNQADATSGGAVSVEARSPSDVLAVIELTIRP